MTKVKARFKTTSVVSSRSRLVDYRAGQFIFHAGDLGSEMFVIHDGKAEVVRRTARGTESIAVLEKGDFFGEMAVLEGLPRTASVRALTDLKLVRVDGATFTKLLRAEPEIAVRIMRKFSRRLRELDTTTTQPEPPVVVVGGEVKPPSEPPPEARFIHQDSDEVFELPVLDETLIGRRDPITGIQPQIDLSGVDSDRSCSRQHAKVLRDGDRFFLVEDIGTTNGTYVQGKRLVTGVPEELQTGIEVKFGTVVLTFEV